MPCQQVCALPAPAAMFLVLTVRDGDAATEAVRSVLASFPGRTRSVSFRVPDAELIAVLGVGARMWDRLFPGERPAQLHEFEEIRGAAHTAVATRGDLLLHLRAQRLDMCFELAQIVLHDLEGHVDVVDEVHGFKFFDERDLLGFVDGTENPEGQIARETVEIGQEDARFAGGSYVIIQKYLHDLAAWNAQSVEEQEKVIGRSKLEDIEMADDARPSNSHVALNSVTDTDGNDLRIYRENMPFGKLGEKEFGTYFIGYAKDPAITERMLRNMFIGVPEGNHDRILDFSTATTGCLFFVPSERFLDGV